MAHYGSLEDSDNALTALILCACVYVREEESENERDGQTESNQISTLCGCNLETC